ncbi:hypothetical protein FB451DRAFT_1409356 [Mycena latifolia]|nr:hypothetical protein FB451DRAFT_1409356 [Mycena latifolia]
MIMQGDPEHRAATAHATRLLLAARTRVLSLAEQCQLAPQLPTPAASESALLAPPDFTSLAVHNPALAAALFRTLTPPTASLRASYLSALAGLPATLPTFDVLGRLLRDSSSAIAALKIGPDVRKFPARSVAFRTGFRGTLSDNLQWAKSFALDLVSSHLSPDLREVEADGLDGREHRMAPEEVKIDQHRRDGNAPKMSREGSTAREVFRIRARDEKDKDEESSARRLRELLIEWL